MLHDETSIVFFPCRLKLIFVFYTDLVIFFIIIFLFNKPFSLQLRDRDFFWGHEQFEDAFVSYPVMAAMDFCLSAFPTIQGQFSMGFLPFFFLGSCTVQQSQLKKMQYQRELEPAETSHFLPLATTAQWVKIFSLKMG